MYFLLEKVNFHCHVSLLEGKYLRHITRIPKTWIFSGILESGNPLQSPPIWGDQPNNLTSPLISQQRISALYGIGYWCVSIIFPSPKNGSYNIQKKASKHINTTYFWNIGSVSFSAFWMFDFHPGTHLLFFLKTNKLQKDQRLNDGFHQQHPPSPRHGGQARLSANPKGVNGLGASHPHCLLVYTFEWTQKVQFLLWSCLILKWIFGEWWGVRVWRNETHYLFYSLL